MRLFQWLLRSLLFWAGLFALGSISFGWLHTRKYESHVWTHDIIAMNAASGVFVGRVGFSDSEAMIKELPHESLGNIRFAKPHLTLPDDLWPTNPGEDSPDLWFSLEMVKNATDNWMLFIPYWLILLVVSVAWLSALFWTSKRRKQAPPQITLSSSPR